MRKPLTTVLLVMVALLLWGSAHGVADVNRNAGGETVSVEVQPERRIVQAQTVMPGQPLRPSDVHSENSAFLPLAGASRLHPALGSSPGGTRLRGHDYFDGTYRNTYWQYSTDSGSSWSSPLAFTFPGCSYPAVDYWGSGSAYYGTAVSPTAFYQGAGVLLLKFDTATSPTSWSGLFTGYNDDGWYGMSMIDIASSNSAQTWNWGLISLIMNYQNAEMTVLNAPHIFSQIGTSSQVQLSWFPQYQGCLSTAVDIDSANKFTYAVYDRLTPPNNQWQLLVRQDRFDDWFVPTNTAFLKYSDQSKHLKYPAIAAHDDTVLIAAMMYHDSNTTNTDIVCWNTFKGNPDSVRFVSTIAGTTDPESYPELAHLTGEKYVCTFVKGDMLYAAISCNGGLSWSPPLLLTAPGQTVINEYRTADISDDGAQVTWQYLSGSDTLLGITRLGELDVDNDGQSLCVDNCPTVANPTQTDSDGDGVGNACDICPGFDDHADTDQDSIPNGCDNCPALANPLQADADGDGIGDDCDLCTDTDGDGFGNPGFSNNTCPVDNCPAVANATQNDADGDGFGDFCDNCPSIANVNQQDSDHDGSGDVCDLCTDTDGDGFGDPRHAPNTCPIDNCPTVTNPDQTDSDSDGIGDVCEVACGDVNGSGSVNIADAVYLINHVFKSGPPPASQYAADVNQDSAVNVGDVIFLINHILKSGPAPCT